MHDDDTPLPIAAKPGTSAALEQRVARLERQYDQLATTVNTMAVDVAVSRTKLESVDHSLTTISKDMRDFTASIRESIADPQASPAGRAVLAELHAQRSEGERIHDGLTDKVGVMETTLDRNTVWIAVASAVVTVAVIVLTFFGPALRILIGLPA